MKWKLDDLTKKKHDADFVSLNQEYEIRLACMKFRCTRSELFEAVKKVGHSRARLNEYFKKK